MLKNLLFIFLFLVFCGKSNAQFYGPDNIRISTAGGSGSTLANTDFPDVAFNSKTEQFLVVWQSDDTDQTGVIDNNDQIIGSIVDINGNIIIEDFKISSLEVEDKDLRNRFPKVSYNPILNNYLVVFEGITTSRKTEIYSAIVSSNGSVSNTFKISNTGGSDTDGRSPNLVYNTNLDEFLLIYFKTTFGEGTELFGQRLNTGGLKIGFPFKIDANFDSINVHSSIPSIVFNTTSNEYLIVFQASTTGLDEDIYSAILSETGTVSNPVRLSSRGDLEIEGFGFQSMDAVYNPLEDNYFVVYDNNNVSRSEIDVFGTILDSGLNVITPEFEISKFGTNNPLLDASFPNVVWLASNNYYVTFSAGRSGQNEVYLREVSKTGVVATELLGVSNSSQFSRLGSASKSAMANNADTFLTVFRGDDFGDDSSTIDNEFEIFGKLYKESTLSNSNYEKQLNSSFIPSLVNNSMDLSLFIDDFNTFEIFNFSGRMIYRDDLEHKINLSGLSNGLYIIKLKGDSNFITSRFFKY